MHRLDDDRCLGSFHCSASKMNLELVTPAGQRKIDPNRGSMAEIFQSPNAKIAASTEKQSEANYKVHGRKTVSSGSVAKCMEAMRVDGFQRKLNDIAESIYKSRQTEPLGKSRKWDYTLPDPQHAYGNPQRRGGSVSDMFSTDGKPETRQVHALYSKSHHDFYPGEQINRMYAWPKQVSQDFSFGMREDRKGTVADAFKWDTGPSNDS